MAVNLKGRSFLTLEDFTPGDIRYLLDLGHDLKAKRRAGISGHALEGKHIVLLFEKTSTRTRCSFEVAATSNEQRVRVEVFSKSSTMCLPCSVGSQMPARRLAFRSCPRSSR